MKPEIKFTKRMLALFGAPDAASVEDVVNEYANALRGETEAILDLAADKLARSRRIRAWPTVAECLDAVADVKRAPTTARLKIIENFDKWFAERTLNIIDATSEGEIQAQLAIVEPYYVAKWIKPSHWQECCELAERARKRIKRDAANVIAMRTAGERY